MNSLGIIQKMQLLRFAPKASKIILSNGLRFVKLPARNVQYQHEERSVAGPSVRMSWIAKTATAVTVFVIMNILPIYFTLQLPVYRIKRLGE